MEIFCFQTPNRNWRVIEFLDEPLHVEEVADRAKELEDKIVKELKLKLIVPMCPTVPAGDDAVGRWMYLPYHFDHDKCYTPDGRPLSLQQFFLDINIENIFQL